MIFSQESSMYYFYLGIIFHKYFCNYFLPRYISVPPILCIRGIVAIISQHKIAVLRNLKMKDLLPLVFHAPMALRAFPSVYKNRNIAPFRICKQITEPGTKDTASRHKRRFYGTAADVTVGNNLLELLFYFLL